MVVVEMVMVVITAMETILQGVVTTVAHNPHHITNVTMHTDISHIVHGEQEETVLEKVTVVQEVEKV
jgi:hypothetical protein